MKPKIFRNIFSYFKEKFFLYIFYGGLNTLISFIIYCLLINLNIFYMYAHTISTLFSIIFVYFLFSKFIWIHRGMRSIRRFIELIIINYFLSIILLFVLIDIFNINVFISPLINIVLLTFFRFYILNNYVFKD